jgi:hypothetical protein
VKEPAMEAGDETTAPVELPAQQITSCGDVSCEFLVDPIPRPKPPPFRVRLKPEEDEVVLIDNRKPNSMEILRMAQAILRERGVRVREEIVQKATAGQAVHKELFGKLRQEKGLLLFGVND